MSEKILIKAVRKYIDEVKPSFLVGNGINRYFEKSASWNKMLAEILDKSSIEKESSEYQSIRKLLNKKNWRHHQHVWKHLGSLAR